MIISLQKELSPDLVNHEGWPLFSGRPDLKHRCSPLAAYTLSWRCAGIDGGSLSAFVIASLHSHLSRAIEKLDCGLQIFVANLSVQPRAAVVLHRKLWKNFSIAPVPDGVEISSEMVIECPTGVRFAGFANVSRAAVPWMIGVAYQFDVVIPLMSRKPFSLIANEPAILELAGAAFPPGGCSDRSRLDWAGLVCQIASLDCIGVRIMRDLSVGEIVVDFFGSEAQVSVLASAFGKDDELTSFRLQ
jgi:hypothetical protein